jgi:transcriptional regulator with XRE-family HTH domain
MLLHEAVRKARQELNLSQKKLAEQAGIQRRQLATLEKGGNVTLATLRKVIAQLPNLESFTLDTVRVTVAQSPGDTERWKASMRAISDIFAELSRSGNPPMEVREEATLQILRHMREAVERDPPAEEGAEDQG